MSLHYCLIFSRCNYLFFLVAIIMYCVIKKLSTTIKNRFTVFTTLLVV